MGFSDNRQRGKLIGLILLISVAFTVAIVADGYFNNQNSTRQKELEPLVPVTGSEPDLPSAEPQVSSTLTSTPYINPTEATTPSVTTIATNTQDSPKPTLSGTTIPITSTPQATSTSSSTQTAIASSTPTTTPTPLPTNTQGPTNTPRPSNTPRPTHTPKPTKTPK